jgi:hypothetical protein
VATANRICLPRAEPIIEQWGIFCSRSPQQCHKPRITVDAGRQSVFHTVHNAYDEHEGISLKEER